jgi:hypothetical protein
VYDIVQRASEVSASPFRADLSEKLRHSKAQEEAELHRLLCLSFFVLFSAFSAASNVLSGEVMCIMLNLKHLSSNLRPREGGKATRISFHVGHVDVNGFSASVKKERANAGKSLGVKHSYMQTYTGAH